MWWEGPRAVGAGSRVTEAYGLREEGRQPSLPRASHNGQDETIRSFSTVPVRPRCSRTTIERSIDQRIGPPIIPSAHTIWSLSWAKLSVIGQTRHIHEDSGRDPPCLWPPRGHSCRVRQRLLRRAVPQVSGQPPIDVAIRRHDNVRLGAAVRQHLPQVEALAIVLEAGAGMHGQVEE